GGREVDTVVSHDDNALGRVIAILLGDRWFSTPYRTRRLTRPQNPLQSQEQALKTLPLKAAACGIWVGENQEPRTENRASDSGSGGALVSGAASPAACGIWSGRGLR